MCCTLQSLLSVKNIKNITNNVQDCVSVGSRALQIDFNIRRVYRNIILLMVSSKRRIGFGINVDKCLFNLINWLKWTKLILFCVIFWTWISSPGNIYAFTACYFYRCKCFYKLSENSFHWNSRCGYKKYHHTEKKIVLLINFKPQPNFICSFSITAQFN